MAVIRGNARKNNLGGTSSNDSIFGLGGNDTLRGNGGSDKLFGGSGNDKLFGGAGNDRLTGGSGNDQFFGGAGNDRQDGGSGNDYFKGDAGRDTINGGNGTDTLDYSFVSGPVTVNLRTGSGGGGDRVSGIEIVIGTSSGDTMISTDGGETLIGGAGNDAYSGFFGDDIFQIQRSGTDTADFTRLAGNTDKILISGAEFGIGATLDDGVEFFNNNNGNTTGDSAQFIYDTNDQTLFFDPDGGTAGGVDKITVLIITGDTFAQFGTNLQVSDFIIV